MRKIVVIGTLHYILPKKREELQGILESINPDQVLVEITQSGIRKKQWKKFPKEMVFAYRWSVRNKKKVAGFDSPIWEVKSSVSKKQLNKIDAIAVKEFFSKHDWKELNQRKLINKGMSYYSGLFDEKKSLRRNKEMIQNIRTSMRSKGTVLILAGTAHLPFLEKHLKKAEFPFRN